MKSLFNFDFVQLRPRLVTAFTALVAFLMAWALWSYYVYSPWTRDGRVRVDVVTIASQVSGIVTKLHVADNQIVKKGDILFEIEPIDYQIALTQAEATVKARQLDQQVAAENAERRVQLGDQAVSIEERNMSRNSAELAAAAYISAVGARDQARVNLERTTIRSPVNGYVTNLTLREGDYAVPGQTKLTLVDSDSFWVAGYFEETKLPRIHIGDSARIKLIGWSDEVSGHVESFSRAIGDTNSETNPEGLQNINPIFTWVRLAQRIPVRIHIDHVPSDVELAAGQTCTIVLSH